MAGKVTFREHLNDGGWEAPVQMSPGDWKAIEEAAGALSAVERESIAKVCAQYRVLMQLEDAKAPDIRATLEALLKIPGDYVAARAMADCDSTTHALLEEVLYEMDGPAFSEKGLRAAKIHGAALLVLHRFPKSKGGAPKKGWRTSLANWVLNYASRHRLGNSISSFNGNSTPPVQLLMALLWVIDPNAPGDDSAAVKLLAEARKRVSA